MEGFKKKSSKAFRRRRQSSNSESDDNAEKVDSAIEDLKELQKARKRQHGIGADDLNAVTVAEKITKQRDDPLKLSTGGYVDYKTLKKGMTAELEQQIGTAFASETNRRDEDAEMLKYVEEQMAKKKGYVQEDEAGQTSQSEKEKLYELPDHIKNIVPTKKRKEDMLSNQMLSGIPEIDLGVDVKIKNIEQTEEAKQLLIEERNRKKNKVSDFVPTNYAVNFVQHNRFNIEDHTPKMKKVSMVPEPTPLRVGDVERIQTGQDGEQKPTTNKPKHNEKATDDFHFEKFKRQMRKY